MKVSFIATVLNEEGNIDKFLHSIFDQSCMADEVIIVDGGSTDNTISEISNFKLPASNSKAKIKLIFKKGNRSVGRNEAIKNARNEVVVCSDAGCILDKDWIKNIVEPFRDSKVDVVAGYYRGKTDTIFQKCLVPYVLVMLDKVNGNEFLPATRSMAFKKSIWKKAGGFNEQYSHNEDYVFAHKLKEIGAHIIFEKNAIVHWLPRKNIKDAFIMFYRFAKGDAESRIFRTKVLLIFFRYIIVFSFLILFFVFKSYFMLNTLYVMLFSYVFWSILKNYKYVNELRAIFYLPLIQITSDIAVILGTIKGLLIAKKNAK